MGRGQDISDRVQRPHRDPLPFTLNQIRDKIPKELFEADPLTSWLYIVRDLAQFAVVWAVMYFIVSPYLESLPWLGQCVAWAAYAFLQGTTGFGIWVIGHECGHMGYFGPQRRVLNDVVGFVIHSAWLTPYFSWKYSHGTHHKFTNLKSKDTAFVPRGYPGLWWTIGEWFPPSHVFLITAYLLLGWPAYLIANLEGHRYKYVTSHFNPFSPIFRDEERMFIVLSDVGVAVMGCILYAFAQAYGWTTVALWYGGPFVVTFAWLVVVTFLQHTDERIAHYEDDDDWTFVKGALSTVDRDYGVFNQWLHHITNGHVMHHFFSTMPFYNAMIATTIVREELGKFYVTDRRPLWKQLWESWWVHQSSFLRNKEWTQKQQRR